MRTPSEREPAAAARVRSGTPEVTPVQIHTGLLPWLAGGSVTLVLLALFLSLDEPWSLRGDNKLMIFPGMLEAWRQWVSGQLPVWTNGQWSGFPLLADPNLGSFYVPNLLMFLLTPAPHLRAFDVGTALHAGVLISGTITLLRRLGAGRAAACFGASLTLMLPQLLFWSSFLNAFSALAWLPWLVIMADACTSAPNLLSRPLVLGAGMLAAQQLSSYPEIGIYGGGLTVLWILLCGRGISLRQRVLRAGLLALGGLLLAAPQLLPTAVQISDSQRALRSPWYSLITVELAQPWHLVDPRAAADGGLLVLPFLGAATLCLGAVAVISRRRGALFLTTIALGAALLALGEALPFYPLLVKFPPFELSRIPAKFYLLTQLATVWLAALGLQRLLSARGSGSGRRAMAGLLASLALVEHAYPFAAQLPHASQPHRPAETRVPAGLEPLRDLQPMLTAPQATGGPPPRVLFHATADVFGGLGMIYGVEATNGPITQLLSPRHRTLLRGSPMSRAALDLFGVQLVYIPGPCAGYPPRGLRTAFRDDRVCVLRNPIWPLRYALIPRVRVARTEAEMIDLVQRDPTGPLPLLFPEGALTPQPVRPGPGDTVTVLDYRPGRVHLRIETSGPQWLLARESWKRGWHAVIDDRPVPVVRAAALFFAIPVPAGRHELELRYWPPGLSAGLGLAAAWIGVVLGSIVYRRWKIRASSAARAVRSSRTRAR
ncbi:MAG: YfhO family protein [Myxococcota bacterium]